LHVFNINLKRKYEILIAQFTLRILIVEKKAKYFINENLLVV